MPVDKAPLLDTLDGSFDAEHGTNGKVPVVASNGAINGNNPSKMKPSLYQAKNTDDTGYTELVPHTRRRVNISARRPSNQPRTAMILTAYKHARRIGTLGCAAQRVTPLALTHAHACRQPLLTSAQITITPRINFHSM